MRSAWADMLSSCMHTERAKEFCVTRTHTPLECCRSICFFIIWLGTRIIILPPSSLIVPLFITSNKYNSIYTHTHTHHILSICRVRDFMCKLVVSAEIVSVLFLCAVIFVNDSCACVCLSVSVSRCVVAHVEYGKRNYFCDKRDNYSCHPIQCITFRL